MKTERNRLCWTGMALALLLPAASAAAAETRVWDGTTGNWEDAGRWGGTVPQNGDAVTVSSGAILLTNATAALASFTITNTATLTFTNLDAKLAATDVMIHGTVTHVANDGTNTVAGEWPIIGRVWIECTNLTVGVNGTIDANSRGYGHTGSPYLSYGPGAGTANADRAAGGGYGGRGGDSPYAAGGSPYGIAADPVQPGSSGGGRISNGDSGGWGGGLVRIDAASNVTVNGSITVNGAAGSGSRPGGGSGGGMRIACRTLQGTGSITANGGNGSASDTGGGGGGRIAVLYDADAQADLPAQPTIAFAANPGLYGSPRPGTIYLTDTRFFPPLSLVSQGAQVINPTANFVLASLNLAGSSSLVFPTGAVIQIAGNLTISNTACLEIYEGSLSVSSNVTVTNAAKLYVFAGVTNAGTTNYSVLVSVTGDVTVASGAYIYSESHPTNGGSPLFRMNNLTILSGGYFEASGRGFASSYVDGYGPGGGKGGGENWVGGGGHGGVGGTVGAFPGGGTYGSSNAPVDAGSGGGGRTSGLGGRGGGVVRLEVNETASVDGTIAVDGGASIVSCGGGGAGGSIFVQCKTLRGAGYLYARGGNSVLYGGAGGGGRVALTDWLSDTFSGTISVIPGTVGNAAGTGTICRIQAAGTYILTFAGTPRQLGSPLYPYGVTAAFDGTTITNTVDALTTQGDGLRWACAGWTVTNANDPGFLLEGTGTQAVFTVTTNLIQTWLWETNAWYLTLTAGPNGSLQSDLSGWYTNGTYTPTITAVPSNGYTFSQWTGVGAPADSTANPVSLRMDRVRTLQANFASSTPTAKTWGGGNGSWADANQWLPPGVPGRYDSVTITSGTVRLADSVWAGSVLITNTVTLTFSNLNAKLTTGDMAIHGTVTHAANAVTSAVGGVWATDACVWIQCANLTVGTNGRVDVSGRGYAGTTGNGYGPGGGQGGTVNWAGGGGHGGAGGSGQLAGGGTYGSTNAPVDPGSSGGGRYAPGIVIEASGAGGGAVRLEVNGKARIDGMILADGVQGPGSTGGGAGGSIWVKCVAFQGDGYLYARGGASGTFSGSGGGGRIAVWRSKIYSFAGKTTDWTSGAGDFNTNHVSVAGGATSGGQGGVGTVQWMEFPPPGGVLLLLQ